MSNEELKELLEETGIPWEYHHWERPPELPYGVWLDPSEDIFHADNVNYASARMIRLEVYTAERDWALDDKVSGVLQEAEIPHDVYHDYLADQLLYRTTFEIEV